MNEEKSTFRVQAFSQSDKARRPNNEDTVAIWEPEDFGEREKNGCIYVVADGVGGAAVGERASKYAAEKVVFEFTHASDQPTGERLRRTMKQANREIFAYAEDHDMRMATTLVAAVIRGNQLFVANVGDSRAYLIRGADVKQLTHDHSLVGERVRDGSMTEAEAQASKIKNRLTRSIGGEPEVSVDIFDPVTLKPGDKLLLCSDGLTRYALNRDLMDMTSHGSAQEIAERLVSYAKKRGGADNVSVVVAVYEPSTAVEPTIHAPRPSDVTLADVMQTHPVVPKYGGVSKPRPALGGLAWGLAGMFSVVLLVVVGWLIYSYAWATPTPTPTSPPAAATAVPPTQQPFLNDQVQPTDTAVLTPVNENPPAVVTEPPAVGDGSEPGNTQPPVVIEPTLSPPPTSPVMPVSIVLFCPDINVRLKPNTNEDNPAIGKIPCQKPVVVQGKYCDTARGQLWFQIVFAPTSNQTLLAWVIEGAKLAPSVLVPLEVKQALKFMDSNGVPLSTDLPQPIECN